MAVNYRRSAAAAEETVGDIRARGGRAQAIEADLADWDAAERLVTQAHAAFGSLDLLVNNAGMTRAVPFSDLDAVDRETWDDIFDLNLRAMFALARAAAPLMLRGGGGRILNVASNSGLTADGSSIPYVVSKAGVIALTHALARGLAPTVLVNAIAPGWMETGWLGRHIPADRRATIAAAPVPPAAVADVVSAALALLTNDSITGEVLVVDRGERWHPDVGQDSPAVDE